VYTFRNLVRCLWLLFLPAAAAGQPQFLWQFEPEFSYTRKLTNRWSFNVKPSVQQTFNEPAAEGAGTRYQITDYQRGKPLLLLGLVFAAVVIGFARWRGLAALGGLAVTFTVLLAFVLPAVLAGSSPLLVAVVGASTIMLVALYLTHGVSVRTSVAVLGTLIGALIGVPALIAGAKA